MGFPESARREQFDSPQKKKRFCVLRSPFTDKDSREHFDIYFHKRLIDIHKVTDAIEVRGFLDVEIPPGVSYAIRFEHNRKPIPNHKLKENYVQRWTSKYVEHKDDMEKRMPLAEELLSAKYDGDRLLDWPDHFEIVKKFPSDTIRRWLETTKANHEERLAQEEAGTTEEYPIDYRWNEGHRPNQKLW